MDWKNNDSVFNKLNFEMYTEEATGYIHLEFRERSQGWRFKQWPPFQFFSKRPGKIEMWGSKMVLCSVKGIFKACLCAIRNFLEKGKVRCRRKVGSTAGTTSFRKEGLEHDFHTYWTDSVFLLTYKTFLEGHHCLQWKTNKNLRPRTE